MLVTSGQTPTLTIFTRVRGGRRLMDDHMYFHYFHLNRRGKVKLYLIFSLFSLE